MFFANLTSSKYSSTRTFISRYFRFFVLALSFSILAAPARAQVTSLTMNSDSGDYIGGGQFQFYTPSDGVFSAYQNYDQGVSLSFNSAGYEHWWYLDFAAPNDQLLTVGTYNGATRFPFQASSEPGLSVTGDGRGCNTNTGSFTVLEVSYGSNGAINSFDAIFEQHCEGMTPAVRGEIRYNAHPVVTMTAPAQLTFLAGQPVNFAVSATDAASRHVRLSVVGLPNGATFVDNGNNSGVFNWPSSTGGSYLLTFQGDNLAGNIGATYTRITVTAQNDDFNNASVIRALPVNVTQDVINATRAPDDPYGCSGGGQTVWYAFTPTTDMRLEANTYGSNYDTVVSVYTGVRGDLTQVICNDDSNGTAQSRVRFDAIAGTTYYFMASSFSYYGSSSNLVFNLLQAPPPLNISPSVTQFGTVQSSNGTVTLSGFVNSSQPTYVTIQGQLKQMRGRTPITGYFSAFVPCTAGITPWNVTVQNVSALFRGRSSALFAGGKADVSATISGYDPDTGEAIYRNLSATITLRGKN